MNTTIIGITGPSGSGKSSILKEVKKLMGFFQVEVLSQDLYYRPAEEQAMDEQGKINFDLPKGIDHNRFVSDVQKLCSGEKLTKPAYNYNNPNAKNRILTFYSTKILFLEGLFLFDPFPIDKFLDCRIYIDSSNELNLVRRQRRDQTQRGQSLEQINYQWIHHVLPTTEKYLLPQKKQADFILQNKDSKRKSAQMLIDFLTQRGIYR
ncbi:MAG: uridine kinase [Bacteroidota bacterium]|nr:uridine kinase [Bacteroidota bacterium]